MNLVLFTPAIKTSAIGRMAALVTHTLAVQGNEVTIVRTEAESLLQTDTHDFGTSVLPWNDSARLGDIFQRADIFVYQIGNNYEFHQGGLHWLPSLPGLVCLHDFYLAHLFHGWARSRRAEADAVLRTWYGNGTADRFFGSSNGDAFIESTLDISPMTEWICAMAYGVITHSNWGCERVLKSCPGPVRVVPLAYDAPVAAASGSRSPSADNERMQILTIGHVNPNKRVESVIRAIGNSPLLRQRVVYRLVGLVAAETVNSLYALARNLGVALVISGELDDADLSKAISDCNVICCLRWPSLEAASASGIEAMLYGKPVIVTDAGFFRELPGSCVLKISPYNEIDDLQSAMERMLNDPKLRAMLGGSGQQWASQTFTSENYVRELIDTVEEIMRVRPTISAINYFSNLMHQWSASGEMSNIGELARALRIFEKSPLSSV